MLRLLLLRTSLYPLRGKGIVNLFVFITLIISASKGPILSSPNRWQAQSQFSKARKAADQLKSSPILRVIIRQVLELGNYLNDGTYRGSASGFRIQALLSLQSIRGTDGKTSLLDFIVEELIEKSSIKEGQLRNELDLIKPTAGLSLDHMGASVREITKGIDQVRALFFFFFFFFLFDAMQ